jgi:hypothetical protein
MKRIYSLILIFQFFNTILIAQTKFQKEFTGVGYCVGQVVHQTSDGGYLICAVGNSTSPTCCSIIRTNALGDTTWTKNYIISIVDIPYFIQSTADSGYLIGGTSQNSSNGFLLKTDSVGNLHWAKTIDLGLYGICKTNNNNYVITGTHIGAKGFLAEVDENGNVIWCKDLSDAGIGKFVQRTTDGGFIIAAVSFSIGAGSGDVYIIKTDSSGQVLWSKTYGGQENDQPYCIRQTTDGGYILGGFANGNAGSTLLIKTDSNGDTTWTKTYGGTGYDYAYCVQQSTDGGYVFSGVINHTIWKVLLLKTNETGNIIWARTYNPTSMPHTGSVGFYAEQTSDGGFIVTGAAPDLAGGSGIYLIKTDNNGSSGCNDSSCTMPSIIYPITVASQITTVSTFIPTINVDTITLNRGYTIINHCNNVAIPEIASNKDFFIYPNPSEGELYYRTNKIENKSTIIKILNLFGNIVYESTLGNGTENRINANIPPGLYFIDIINSEYNNIERLIIK